MVKVRGYIVRLQEPGQSSYDLVVDHDTIYAYHKDDGTHWNVGRVTEEGWFRLFGYCPLAVDVMPQKGSDEHTE